MSEFELIPSLVQASPSAAVAIVGFYFFYKVYRDFSKTIKDYSKEHADTQLKTVTKMQELTEAINRLKEEVMEQSGIIKKMYQELWKKQKKIDKYEKRKTS